MEGENKDMALKYLPWWTRIAAKIVLSRLPVSYSFWRKLGLFRHGEMNSPERAVKTFETFYARALKHQPLPAGFRSLELGPGDSILSGLAARAHGASHAWLVDAGRFADTDVEGCRAVIELYHSQGKTMPDVAAAATINDVLDKAGVTYLVNGTASLAEIPDGSIDFFWSQVVLEHVSKREFPQFMRELRRVAAPGAIGVHSIDFRDHLGGALNNLRFSEGVWEGDLFTKSGFYTNRLRPREMIGMFRDAGFDVEVMNEVRWPEIPTDRKAMAREFDGMPDEDFMVAESEVILRPVA